MGRAFFHDQLPSLPANQPDVYQDAPSDAHDSVAILAQMASSSSASPIQVAEEPPPSPPLNEPCARRKTRWHVGSKRWHEQHQHLPPGPANASDFGEWPLTLAESIFSNDTDAEGVGQSELRLIRCLRIVENGLVVHTDYSGKQCPEVGLRLWSSGLLQYLEKVKHHVLAKLDVASWPCVVSWRACDIGRLSQKVICEGCHKPQHYFEDVSSRLPEEVRKQLCDIRPNPKSDVMVRKAAFESMNTYLDTVKEKVFTRDAMAPCKIHPDTMCPVTWKDPKLPAGKRPT